MNFLFYLEACIIFNEFGFPLTIKTGGFLSMYEYGNHGRALVPDTHLAALLQGVLCLGWGQGLHLEKAPHVILIPTRVGELDPSIVRVGRKPATLPKDLTSLFGPHEI